MYKIMIKLTRKMSIMGMIKKEIYIAYKGREWVTEVKIYVKVLELFRRWGCDFAMDAW